MKKIEGGIALPSARVAIVIARFNRFINDHLLAGAVDVLKRLGQVTDDNISVIWVPGAYEIPLAAKMAAKSGNYDGIVALGTIIRGQTAHFDYVADGSNSGLMTTSLEFNIPIGFGILTTESVLQAIERAGTKAGNKGAEAALAMLEMLNIVKQL